MSKTTVSFSSKYSSLCFLHSIPIFASEYLDFACLGRFIFPSLAVKFWISQSSTSHFLSHTPPQSFFFSFFKLSLLTKSWVMKSIQWVVTKNLNIYCKENRVCRGTDTLAVLRVFCKLNCYIHLGRIYELSLVRRPRRALYAMHNGRHFILKMMKRHWYFKLDFFFFFLAEFIILSLWVSQVALVVKNPPATADVRDTGSIPGSGRSSGEGNGNPLQYSYLENHGTVHRVTKSWTRLKWLSSSSTRETGGVVQIYSIYWKCA